MSADDPVDFPKAARVLAPVPPPLPGAPEEITIAETLPLPSIPTVSLAPGAEPGTHELSLAPHTRLENYGPPPSAWVMLVRVSPYLVAIAGFIYWGAIGKAEPSAAAGFITALIVATLNSRGGGPTVGALVAKNAKAIAARVFKKKDGAK